MLLNYIKITFRNFAKQRLFSSLNIVGLGIGMAAVWLMVLYVADELSYDRFHSKADRIYRLTQQASWNQNSFHIPLTSAPFAKALENDYPEIEKTVRISTEGGGKIRYKEAEMVAEDIYFTDPAFFDVFSYPFLYGDSKTALVGPQKIVLTRSLAEKLFAKPSEALGKTVTFSNNYPNVVTGVIEDSPANSHLHFSALRSLTPGYTTGWQQFEIYTYALLRDGSDAQKLQSKLGGFFEKYLRKEMGEGIAYKLELQPLTSIHLHSHLEFELSANGNINTVYIFSAIAALILIIACINYINLYTARSLKRIKEVGVRKSIGSERSQLISQFLTESLMMTFAAGFIALLFILIGLPLFNNLAEKSLTADLGNTPLSLAVGLAFVLTVGLLSGLYPAVAFSGFRPVVALKGKSGDYALGAGFRKSLVVFQFAATVVMIACSAVVYKQIHYVNTKDLGFNKSQVLVFHIDRDDVRNKVGSLKEKLLQSPLIEAASGSSNKIGTNFIGSSGMTLETEAGEMPEATQMVQKFQVDGDFLNTMQIKLLAGRTFDGANEADRMGAILVNEALVKKQGWQNAIGKKISYPIDGEGNKEVAQVVGVMKDFHIYSLQNKIEPLVLQLPAPMQRDNLYVRIQAGRTKEALAYLRDVYRTFDPESTPDLHFLDETFAQQYKMEQKQGDVMLTFAVLSVVIACLGLFGLAAFAAESRTKEIGIRKVMGASVQSVMLLLSKDFIRLVLIAIVIGTPVAVYAMDKWLQIFEYRETLSWWVFAGAGLLAVVIALATVSFQALKSALTNPVKSLCAE